ncbi:acylamino-acid-releasing enzyme-like [Mya arenaria]|uniref:acylamino-acid-releasing enzyme-like n=1 Tax=Mya arenaria TaxID=6604 RepID=UPI0022E5E554|nr:acylamino-acid-releasing enzyme-like [Mya arenaria]XP_052782186.1 acylamino-acid-releasing enzyme-like [Mya arenaria]
MEKAVTLYRDLVQYASTSYIGISKPDSAGSIKIRAGQTQRDLERAEKVKFARSYMVKTNGDVCDVVYESSPEELSNEIWNKESPSGKYRAVMRKVTDKKKEDKYFLEVWNQSCKTLNVDLLASEKHGKVYDKDGSFGCLEWSRKEDKILYIAEKKYKSVSYFAKEKKAGDKEEIVKGEEYLFREEWGEGLVGKHHAQLCVLDLDTQEVTVLESMLYNVSVAYARWAPDDKGIVFTGWHEDPYRLGLIYCPMRKSSIFYLNFETTECVLLSDAEMSSRYPVFSPDDDSFVYLQNKIGGPHMQCSSLMKFDWKAGENTTVVEVVKDAPNDDFPGIYTVTLPENCWCADGRRVVMNTVWRTKDSAIVVDTQTGNVTRLPTVDGCSLTVQNVQGNVVVAECSSPARRNFLVVGCFPAAGKEETMVWCELGTNSGKFEDVDWKVIEHVPTAERQNARNSTLKYSSILMYPTFDQSFDEKKLLVFPHGGPHSAFTTAFQIASTFLCKLGFSILMVNYRGSCGYGNDSIYCLPGLCGDQDVKDVQSAAEEVIKKENFPENRVVIWGGSHGGFLTCHLVGQYPDFYKAAVCRNPVIDIATMVGSSDIPDWSHVESGIKNFDHSTIPNPKTLEAMWTCSPLQYVDQIKAPVMIMIGKDDLRVPTKQSYELYKALKSRNKTVSYIAYPDNGHPIVKVDSEADACINIYKWFTEHLV